MQEHFHFNYRIKKVKRLGSGSFGYVDEVELYNANGVKCPRNYARKTFYPSQEVIDSNIDIDELRERFNEEVKCQASCNAFFVVPIYICDISKNAVAPWYLMDLATEDLHNLIVNSGLSFDEKVKSIIMISKGVENIHNERYLHRDLKPKNILSFNKQQFKLSDFGLVKDLNRNSPLTAIAKVMGTHKYIAPESLTAHYDPRSDIYSLGVVIEEILGQEKNDFFSKVIAKCTMRNPNDRYQSATEILNELMLNYPERFK